ncbi:phosphoribosyltransferase family protein, partial [Candidatus Kapabacteria bacterium]|nr:phosphoribosyltransferase family protein [Candidatus Kapabacteria bacterium]
KIGASVDESFLKRNLYTKTQTKLSSEMRKQNLKNVFSVTKKYKYKNILICDDVYTTGSTMNSLAFELLKTGTENIYGAAIIIA